MRRQKDASPRRSAKKPRKRRAKKSKSPKEVPRKVDKSRTKKPDQELAIMKTPKTEMPSELIDDHYTNDYETERTALITSSTGIADDLEELSISYGDFDEYQEEMGQAEISEEFKHEIPDERASNGYTESFNYVDCGSVQPSTTSSEPVEMKEPIFVDLTADESKGSWKQSLFNKVEKIEESKENSPDSPAGNKSSIAVGESQIMIADSSSRSRRISDAGSLATALKDRGAWSIPIQPNRSLPIRPAPPVPLRSARTVRSPILKLSRALLMDIEEVRSFKSIVARRNYEFNEETIVNLSEHKEKDHLITDPIETNDFLLSTIPSASLNDPKRKIDSVRDSKEGKKPKKAHEPDSSQIQEQPPETVAKNSSQNCNKTIGKSDEILEGEIEIWPEKKCSMTVESTISDIANKDHETGNKLVPPLRLKKITSTGGDRYRSFVAAVVVEKESNYRIVTGATPRPESRFQSHSMTPWTSTNSATSQNNGAVTRNSSGKGDGLKLKNKRNRLKQKLRSLPRKVRGMTSKSIDSNSEKGTNLKDTSKRQENQPKNSPVILEPISSDIVEVDEEYDDDFKDKLYIADYDGKQENLDDDGDKSALSSPEPPKLSPRSPTDYTEHKLLETMRNSPPILPRASLNIPNFETRINNDEKVWRMDDNNARKLFKELDQSTVELKRETARNYNGTEDEIKVMSPALITTQEVQATQVNVENSDKSIDTNSKNILFDCLNKNEIEQTIDESPGEKKDSQDAKIKLQKVVPLNCPDDSKESEKTRLPKISRVENVSNELIVSAVTNVEAVSNVECNKAFELIVPNKNQAKSQSPTSPINILNVPSHYCRPTVNQEPNLPGPLTEFRTSQVSSSSSTNLEALAAPATQPHVLPSTPITPNQRVILLKTNKGEHVQTDITTRTDNIRIMNEQFPTLGSWVSRMSKKQSTRSKSKTQDATNALPVTGENSASFSASDLQKLLTTTANNGTRTNVVNVAPQWNAERWQRQNHNQRQQQQSLHQVAMPGTSQPPLPIAPSLRPGGFYPGIYSIDPYGTPLGYHSAICHFGPYSHHPRLHAGPPLTSYHMPIQEALNSQWRPLTQLQPVDKQFVALHESIRHIPADMLKYTGSLTANGCQHSSGVEYERLRAASLTNNTGSTSCLPQLLMTTSPHVATSSAQMRPTITGHSTSSNQFSRSRIIPDVVAAAAAAAVMAAESIGRQQAPLTSYNQGVGDNTSPNNPPDSSQGTSTVKSAVTNDVNGQSNGQNQSNASNVTKDIRSGGLQHLHNFLMDRLPYMKATDNFPQASSVNDSHLPATATSGYKASHSTYVHGQQCKETLADCRHCETPHLGKVNRSLNIVNELPCSNCGVIGAVFKCLGCEAAFYCDERCQTQHWRVHVEKCPKKMPKLKKVT